MIRTVIVIVSLVMFPAVSFAADSMTVEQCITINVGLNSLNYVGQQLGEQAKSGPDVKQYKLGAARMPIALDIGALSSIVTAAQRADQQYRAELDPIPAALAAGKSDPEREQLIAKENKMIQENWQKILQSPCNVTLVKIKLPDLNIGDGPDQNQIPPSVLGAISGIIDNGTK